jgi:serine/threonine protein kinase/WD40 repeat protein
MNLPGEQQWLRVEELGRGLSLLPPEEVAAQMARLAADGESPTVLSLLGGWLALPPPPAAFQPGSVIGRRYTLRVKLGEGGMGSVWRAKQEMVGRDVALKMIHPSLVTPALQARFLAEIEALAKLDHPGIVRIFDAGLEPQPNGRPVPFFAMELVDGLPLDRWAVAQHHDRRAQLRLAAAVCAAVQSAHERRIVHRDLKPRNILVKPDGQPVVVDFGIARLAGMVVGEEAGVFSGTPAYAAPEQHLGRDADFRSGESVDVYAIGVILFELLSGRKLFEFSRGASISEMRRTVLEAPIPVLSDVLADCPPTLVDIVAKALRRNPADRFYSMAALGRAISRVAEMDGPAPTPPPWTPAANAIIPGTQWRLVEQVGQGGTGQVWLGQHDQLAERRIFKFCDTEEKARTLKRELTLFRLLKEHVGRNPHFIQLHEVSLDEPPWYLMMDHTDALDLQSWSDAQTGGLAAVPELVRLEIVAQAAEALQAAHEAGILHRDIKPANLLIKGGGATGPVHVFIADFGIGQLTSEKLLREGTRLGFTRTVSDLRRDALSGTMLYLAPEVLEGNAATARSDIYSLGVVLWQLLSGNLKAAVDPADWSARITDPLLRDDLGRCLAGVPDKRWSSAGELATSLRSLPDRRAAAERRIAELAARERAAYRRGVVRTVAVAASLAVLFATLAIAAWLQSERAKRSRGEVAVKQATSLRQIDFTAGRRSRGMLLLDAAAKTAVDRAAVRTACAAVLGLPDLVPVPGGKPMPQAAPLTNAPLEPSEVCRVPSNNGAWTAVGRDLDGLNGAVDVIQVATGVRRTIERKQFPWVPVPEPRLLAFSPDDKLLAIGGAATSRHVLICNLLDGSLNSYLYHSSDPLCCGWHSGGRLLAVGCADGAIRIWDKAAALNPVGRRQAGDQFDLPPKLDMPAEDVPAQILRGHRGPVLHLAFSSGGQWLAALDAAGYLRIYTGFCRDGLPRLPDPHHALDLTPESGTLAPAFAVEVRLTNVDQVTALEVQNDHLTVRRGKLPPDEFQFVPGELPAELAIEPIINEIALDAPGAKLCATTPTDILWLRMAPLEIVQIASGQNPLGVSCPRQEDGWMIAKDHELTEWHPATKDRSTLSIGARFRLSEAVPGQATLTAVSAAGDGRVAAYYGKRIQFFRDLQSAAESSSVIANGGDGIFRAIFWDHPGRLLGVVFELPDGDLRLETWATSTNFPPDCRALAPAILECQRIAPANDGRRCIARGGHRGLCSFEPATGKLIALDASSTARQDAAIACACDGSLLAFVADRDIVRLFTLPAGTWYADLYTPRQTDLTSLAWDASSRHLASGTRDGCVQAWDLRPWQDWLLKHGLQK